MPGWRPSAAGASLTNSLDLAIGAAPNDHAFINSRLKLFLVLIIKLIVWLQLETSAIFSPGNYNHANTGKREARMKTKSKLDSSPRNWSNSFLKRKWIKLKIAWWVFKLKVHYFWNRSLIFNWDERLICILTLNEDSLQNFYVILKNFLEMIITNWVFRFQVSSYNERNFWVWVYENPKNVFPKINFSIN